MSEQPPTASQERDADEEDVRTRSKPHWVKKVLLGAVIIIVLQISFRVWWGFDADRALQLEIDRIVASGEPIYPEDFDPSSRISDEDNAARVYVRASKALRVGPTDYGLLRDIAKSIERVNPHLSQLKALATKNEVALDLMRRARPMESTNWDVRQRTPMYAFMDDRLDAMRQLSQLAYASALLCIEERRSLDAFDLIEAMAAMARSVSAHPTLIGNLKSMAYYGLVIQTVEAGLPKLQISSDRETVAESRIPRSRIEALIHELSDEHHVQDGFVRAVQVERAGIVDSIHAVAYGKLRPSSMVEILGSKLQFDIVVLTFRPALLKDARFSLLRLDQAVRAAKEETWPASAAALPHEYPQFRWLDFWRHYLSNLWEPAINRSVLLHFRHLAELRMACIALALRLYEFDHGKVATSLDELVPDYLPAVPIDPFGDGEQALGYVRDIARPRLYSIGPNGIDEEGRVTFRGNGKLNYDRFDIPFFLDGSRPRTAEELNTPALPLPTE